MDDEPLSFEEHRRRRAEDASTVRCARCGAWIVATASRCPECGIHFRGEAQEFVHPSESPPSGLGSPAWAAAAAALLIAAMLIGLFGLR